MRRLFYIPLIFIASQGFSDYTPGSDPQMLPGRGSDVIYPISKPPQGDSSVTPQDKSVNPLSITPVGTLNPMATGGINSPALNGAGIYPIGGQLFIDRSMNINTVTVSSVSISTELTVPQGILNGDAAQFSQLKIVQIVSTTSVTSFATTSNAFQTTNLIGSITPTSASNKIFIIASSFIQMSAQNTISVGTIARGGSNILASNGQWDSQSVSGGVLNCPATLVYVDSPGSTALQTYAIQIANASNNGNTVTWGGGNFTQFMMLAEVVIP